jgi:hypothetical protein
MNPASKRIGMVAIPLAISVAVAIPSEGFAAPSVAMLWKARALEAIDASKRVASSEPGSTGRYKLMIEMAFMLHAAGAKQEQVVHQKDKNGEYFHIMLNGDADGMFDLVYVYSPSGVLTATRVDALPRHWSLLWMHQGEFAGAFAGKLVVGTTGSRVICFDLVDPFSPDVFDTPGGR